MTLNEQLSAARSAYHLLMTGQAPKVIVDQNGERVEFVAANADRLRQYIMSLEAQVAAGASFPRNPRPLMPFF
jgi:hypothetical protein